MDNDEGSVSQGRRQEWTRMKAQSHKAPNILLLQLLKLRDRGAGQCLVSTGWYWLIRLAPLRRFALMLIKKYAIIQAKQHKIWNNCFVHKHKTKNHVKCGSTNSQECPLVVRN